MFRRIIIGATLALALCVTTLMASTSPASADAHSGTCAAGYRLGDYTTHEDAYNRGGEHMWRLTYRKRWCYRASTHRVGSWYATSSVRIYSYFGTAWQYKGITDHDEYYSNRDALGNRHPNFPRWSHASWRVIKMNHCALKWTVCTSHYYHLGIRAFSDGSKKLA